MLCVLKQGQFKAPALLGPEPCRGDPVLSVERWQVFPRMHTPPGVAVIVIVFTKHGCWGRGRLGVEVAESSASPHLCQENPARKQGVASMACHKHVACVDISPASMFPWQCVTGRDTCSKEWGGGEKLAEAALLLETTPPSPDH